MLRLRKEDRQMPITEQLPYQADKSSHRRRSLKKLFVKILQYSQENTCVRSLLNKVAVRKACKFI